MGGRGAGALLVGVLLALVSHGFRRQDSHCQGGADDSGQACGFLERFHYYDSLRMDFRKLVVAE